MAHVGLDVREREDLNGERAERMTEVVEDDRLRPMAQMPELGAFERRVERGSHKVVVQGLTNRAAEDMVLGSAGDRPLAEAVELDERLVDERDAADLPGLRQALSPPRHRRSD